MERKMNNLALNIQIMWLKFERDKRKKWHIRILFEESLVKVTQSCLTLCDPLDCSPTGSSLHAILQARILEWVAIPFSRNLPNPGIKLRPPTLQADSLPSEPQSAVKWVAQAHTGIKLRSPTLQADALSSELPGKPLRLQGVPKIRPQTVGVTAVACFVSVLWGRSLCISSPVSGWPRVPHCS